MRIIAGNQRHRLDRSIPRVARDDVLLGYNRDRGQLGGAGFDNDDDGGARAATDVDQGRAQAVLPADRRLARAVIARRRPQGVPWVGLGEMQKALPKVV